MLVLSGGNIDTNLMARIIEKGLAKTGRLLRVRVELSLEVRGREHSDEVLALLKGKGYRVEAV